MKKRWIFLTIVLMVSLVATTTVSASSDAKRPVWEQAFDPVPYLGEGSGTDWGVAFNGKLYYKFWGDETPGEVWGSPDGKHWSLAWRAGDIEESYDVIGGGTVYKNQLYLTLEDWDEVDLAKRVIMRTPDGLNWEEVAWMEDTEELGGWFSGGFAAFQDFLYIGVCIWNNDVLDARLWRSASGDAGTWEEVAVFPDWNGIAAFAVFKDMLYVSSEWIVNDGPAQVFRSANGMDWEPVTLDGFGDATNIITGSFGQKDGYLYLGTGSYEGGDIWRTQDGMNWQPVSLDGLGNPLNQMFAFVSYKGYLIAYSLNLEQGVHVYASQDGLRWKLINEPGWGDPGNAIVWHDGPVVKLKGALYMGGYFSGRVMRLGVQ